VFLELTAARAEHQFGNKAGSVGHDSRGTFHQQVAGVNIYL
jgi:hypothetical protein